MQRCADCIKIAIDRQFGTAARMLVERRIGHIAEVAVQLLAQSEYQLIVVLVALQAAQQCGA